MKFKTKEEIQEVDNALEGVFWSPEERLQQLLNLSEQATYLSPFKFTKPFAKSFESFEDYEQWKRNNPDPYWRF